ncbi:pre-mRNA-splicing regulator WTAP-like [Centruroides sculpturatus]|uniref:pre-mRNA-splicing regulator WTAP-like n=1 Tax=Centruroides sculpturatus TaxID=218467 RepID=UPI000C6E75EC|nr:pre-mRNA-splicing regulator WTAP-like [Centruroides sculpturatus]
MSKDDLIKKWFLQEQYVEALEARTNDIGENLELVSLRESEEKLKQQQLEATRRENILVMRLTTKEQEMQDYAVSNLFIVNYKWCILNHHEIFIK